MAIFQCAECGCIEYTALGWLHGDEPIKGLTTLEMVGKRVCSACAPSEWASGNPIIGYGSWHAQFDRVFLPHGEFETNRAGNIKHIKSGLIGPPATKKYGRKTQYKKPK